MMDGSLSAVYVSIEAWFVAVSSDRNRWGRLVQRSSTTAVRVSSCPSPFQCLCWSCVDGPCGDILAHRLAMECWSSFSLRWWIPGSWDSDYPVLSFDWNWRLPIEDLCLETVAGRRAEEIWFGSSLRWLNLDSWISEDSTPIVMADVEARCFGVCIDWWWKSEERVRSCTDVHGWWTNS